MNTPALVAVAVVWLCAFALVVASFAAHDRPELARRLSVASMSTTTFGAADILLVLLLGLAR